MNQASEWHHLQPVFDPDLKSLLDRPGIAEFAPSIDFGTGNPRQADVKTSKIIFELVKNATAISVWGGKVTDEGIAAFRKQMPKAVVVPRESPPQPGE